VFILSVYNNYFSPQYVSHHQQQADTDVIPGGSSLSLRQTSNVSHRSTNANGDEDGSNVMTQSVTQPSSGSAVSGNGVTTSRVPRSSSASNQQKPGERRGNHNLITIEYYIIYCIFISANYFLCFNI